jgi:hypothetical protein
MLKRVTVIVVLVAAVLVLHFTSERIEPAHASSAAPTETLSAVSLPANEAALQRLGEAIADDGTPSLPGQDEPAVVKLPEATRPPRPAHRRKMIADVTR